MAEQKRNVYQFQSTLPRGERLAFFEPLDLIDIFQSTLPRGERLL